MPRIGTARGEVARLWMPFMPLLFAAVWSAPVWSIDEAARTAPRGRDGVMVGLLMMLYCITLRYHWTVW